MNIIRHALSCENVIAGGFVSSNINVLRTSQVTTVNSCMHSLHKISDDDSLNECERNNVYIKRTSKAELIIETCSIRDKTALFYEDRQ